MFDVALIGAGPAGGGLLSCLLRAAQTGEAVTPKIALIEAGELGTSGRLADYHIASDTRAEKFLTCLEGLPESVVQNAKLQTLAQALTASGPNAAPLPLVGAFYRTLTTAVCDHLVTAQQLNIYDNSTAHSATWHDTHWDITTHSGDTVQRLKSRHLIMACGATETAERFTDALSPYHLKPDRLKDWALSSHILGAQPDAKIFTRLKALSGPKVAILGGSHSAISAAGKLLAQDIPFSQAAITLYHRSPLQVTFQNAQHARAQGCHDFTDQDICPKTHRVFALKGFRLDSRDLLSAIRGYGDHPREDRVRLADITTLTPDQITAELRDADLVISALGYTPNYIPLYRSPNRSPIPLNAPHFVDDRSRVMDAHGSPLPNAYALGLASNYNLAGRFGEPSFQGQANGLVLWHKEIGQELVQELAQHHRQKLA